MSAGIRVEGLAKQFRGRATWRHWIRWRAPPPVRAIDRVDLTVRPGELVALLGPNGAGKTTLLKVLATLVRPSGGRAWVDGIDVGACPHVARGRVGYVLADDRSFFWRISVRENLRFFAALQGLHGRRSRDRIDELASLVGLTDFVDRPFSDLSMGQRQRVAFARGLLGDPPVVLFDEATRSLDPGRAGRLRRVIRNVLVDAGDKAVLFATHDLQEAQTLADRVVLMVEGRVAADGSFESLAGRLVEIFEAEARAEDEALFRAFPELAEASGASPSPAAVSTGSTSLTPTTPLARTDPQGG